MRLHLRFYIIKSTLNLKIYKKGYTHFKKKLNYFNFKNILNIMKFGLWKKVQPVLDSNQVRRPEI